MDKFRLVVIGAGVFAIGHSILADFSASAHGQTIPVKAPPKAALCVGSASSTSSVDRFDTVTGKELQWVPVVLPQAGSEKSERELLRGRLPAGLLTPLSKFAERGSERVAPASPRPATKLYDEG
jgi:hypothetical protein